MESLIKALKDLGSWFYDWSEIIWALILIVVVVAIVIGVVWAYVDNMIYCNPYANTALAELPARCARIFGR